MQAIVLFFADLLFRFGLKFFTVFARASVWNIALATLTVAAVAASVTLFINVVSGYAQQFIAQATAIPALPYFLPSNLTTCISAYVSIRIAGTVFNATLHFIENRSYILKA